MPELFVDLILSCLVTFVSSSIMSDLACSNQTYCESQWGEHSWCSQGNCACDNLYYLQNNPLTCVECPDIGESCKASQCCKYDYLVCLRGVCMCSDYCCISESERERFQHVAQCVLAIALLLTAMILSILFWRACTRRNMIRRNLRNMSADSFLSLNSIQRLVLLQLQDRPPPYNPECMQPWKNANEISEPPPSYIEAVGFHDISQGEDNIMFIYGEISSREERFNRSSASSFLIPCQTILSSANDAVLRRQSTISVGNNNSVSSMQNPASTGTTVSVPLEIPEEVLHSQNTSDYDTHLIVLTSTELHI